MFTTNYHLAKNDKTGRYRVEGPSGLCFGVYRDCIEALKVLRKLRDEEQESQGRWKRLTSEEEDIEWELCQYGR